MPDGTGLVTLDLVPRAGRGPDQHNIVARASSVGGSHSLIANAPAFRGAGAAWHTVSGEPPDGTPGPSGWRVAGSVLAVTTWALRPGATGRAAASRRAPRPGPGVLQLGQRPGTLITGHSNSFTGADAIVSIPAAAYASTCSALVSWAGVAPADHVTGRTIQRPPL